MNNSNSSMNPDGGDAVWRADREPALEDVLKALQRSLNYLDYQETKTTESGFWELKVSVQVTIDAQPDPFKTPS